MDARKVDVEILELPRSDRPRECCAEAILSCDGHRSRRLAVFFFESCEDLFLISQSMGWDGDPFQFSVDDLRRDLRTVQDRCSIAFLTDETGREDEIDHLRRDGGRELLLLPNHDAAFVADRRVAPFIHKKIVDLRSIAFLDRERIPEANSED